MIELIAKTLLFLSVGSLSLVAYTALLLPARSTANPPKRRISRNFDTRRSHGCGTRPLPPSPAHHTRPVPPARDAHTGALSGARDQRATPLVHRRDTRDALACLALAARQHLRSTCLTLCAPSLGPAMPPRTPNSSATSPRPSSLYTSTPHAVPSPMSAPLSPRLMTAAASRRSRPRAPEAAPLLASVPRWRRRGHCRDPRDVRAHAPPSLSVE